MLAQDVDHLVDVPGPLRGRAVARGLGHAAREHVVEHDHARRRGVPLDVDEVAQRELEQVHAVDEGEVGGRRRVRRAAAKVRERVRPGEEVVAGLADEMDVAADLDRDLERGIDGHRRDVRQGEAAAAVDADLEVRPGLEPRVELGEERVAAVQLLVPSGQARLTAVAIEPAAELAEHRHAQIVRRSMSTPASEPVAGPLTGRDYDARRCRPGCSHDRRRQARAQGRRRRPGLQRRVVPRPVHRVRPGADDAAGRARGGVRRRRVDRRLGRHARRPGGEASPHPRHPRSAVGLGRPAAERRGGRGDGGVHPVPRPRRPSRDRGRAAAVRPGRRRRIGRGPRQVGRPRAAEQLAAELAHPRARALRGRPRARQPPQAAQAAAARVPRRAPDPVPGGQGPPRGPGVHPPGLLPRQGDLRRRRLRLLPPPAPLGERGVDAVGARVLLQVRPREPRRHRAQHHAGAVPGPPPAPRREHRDAQPPQPAGSSSPRRPSVAPRC